MNRDDVIALVASAAERAGAVVFAGNGYNARALCAIADRPEHFTMLGSMGLCPALAAGFASRSDRPVIVVEGDGNALMGLSGLPVAAALEGRTFVHLVLDNGLYETTGGQRTLADRVDFELLARGAGYRHTARAADPDALGEALTSALAAGEPAFVHVPTDRTPGPPHPRVPHHPAEVVRRFREAVAR